MQLYCHQQSQTFPKDMEMQELINCSNTSSKVFNHVEQSNLNNYTQFCLTCYKNKIYLITYQLRSRNNVEKIDGWPANLKNLILSVASLLTRWVLPRKGIFLSLSHNWTGIPAKSLYHPSPTTKEQVSLHLGKD